jgi:FMN phosphatase YigB (HAD superfamily)
MASRLRPLRGVIFDYGNTLIEVDPALASKRADYGDVFARPGAERLERFLVAEGILTPPGGSVAFVERFLEIRERNRVQADSTGTEITDVESLATVLRDLGGARPTEEFLRRAVAEYFVPWAAAIQELHAHRDVADAGTARRMPRRRCLPTFDR